MFENTTKAAADTTDFLNLIDDLERADSTELEKLRAHPRLPIHAQVTIRPGNLSQRFEWSLRASTGDISEGGCRIFANRPLLVGDIYSLEFGVEGTPPVLAICRRCRALPAGKFESGLQFLETVIIGGAESSAEQGGSRGIVAPAASRRKGDA